LREAIKCFGYQGKESSSRCSEYQFSEIPIAEYVLLVLKENRKSGNCNVKN
jgi:hypothetical protein